MIWQKFWQPNNFGLPSGFATIENPQASDKIELLPCWLSLSEQAGLAGCLHRPEKPNRHGFPCLTVGFPETWPLRHSLAIHRNN